MVGEVLKERIVRIEGQFDRILSIFTGKTALTINESMVLAVEIGGFDISRKLFSNEFGLSVFEILEKETGRTFISDYSHLLLQSFSTLSETILEKIEL